MNKSETEIYSPEQDGVNHINVSGSARTELGKKLSIGAMRPFTHPEHGKFHSVIGYLAWFDSNKEQGHLRNLHAGNANRSTLAALKDLPGNRQAALEALEYSVDADPSLKAALAQSELPFVSYTVVNFKGRPEPKVFPVEHMGWYVRGLELLRHKLSTA